MTSVIASVASMSQPNVLAMVAIVMHSESPGPTPGKRRKRKSPQRADFLVSSSNSNAITRMKKAAFQSSDHERGAILAFVQRNKQERFLGFLAKPKNRRKFTASLAHFRWFDERFATPIPWKVDAKGDPWERHVQGIGRRGRSLFARKLRALASLVDAEAAVFRVQIHDKMAQNIISDVSDGRSGAGTDITETDFIEVELVVAQFDGAIDARDRDREFTCVRAGLSSFFRLRCER